MPREGNPNWVPGGPSPNPAGRPKLEQSFGSIAREMLQSEGIDFTYTYKNQKGVVERRELLMNAPKGKTIYSTLVTALIHEAAKGNTKALKLLLERTDGMPKQSIELDGSGGLSLEIVRKIVSKDTLKDQPKEDGGSTNETLQEREPEFNQDSIGQQTGQE